MNPEEWNQYLQTVSSLISYRENYQKLLGEISATIVSKYGMESLNDFSHAVEDSTGHKVSPTTLRNYRWVWEKTSKLGLPEDFPYRAYQAIAGSEDPEKWAKDILNKGLSASEVIYGIKLEKGKQEEKKKTIFCPACKVEFEI